MKKFTDYLKEINDPEVASETPMSGDAIVKICKIAWRKYRSKTERFFRDLAALDPEIKNAMSFGQDDGPVMTAKRREKDEVVPPSADGSPGLDDGGGE